MELNIEKNKEKFIKIYTELIKRDGAEELLKYLTHSDFFYAPASQKYHVNCAGGLCLHSLNVFERLRKLVLDEFGNFDTISEETIAICGLLHDVCKIDFYAVEYRNVKENGEWVKKPVYVIDEKLPYGHGEKSVYIINGFMRLTREEALAINWHMGGFDARVKGGSYGMSEWFYKSELAVLVHLADMMATYLDEHTEKIEEKMRLEIEAEEKAKQAENENLDPAENEDLNLTENENSNSAENEIANSADADGASDESEEEKCEEAVEENLQAESAALSSSEETAEVEEDADADIALKVAVDADLSGVIMPDITAENCTSDDSDK